MIEILIAIGVLLAFSLLVAYRTVRVVPQARAAVVVRLGRYQPAPRTAGATRNGTEPDAA
jgi:regulator of protease activity HflC (stomatin/prohibitin superfamily)